MIRRRTPFHGTACVSATDRMPDPGRTHIPQVRCETYSPAMNAELEIQ